jgi:hypothetical protein
VYRHNQYVARKAWKENAIPEITKYADDTAWVDKEVQRCSAQTQNNTPQVIQLNWLTDRMILMKSGEWLVFKSHCNKRPPHEVRDIFLAKGSDGKWYYSTFHFCVGMCALLMTHGYEKPVDLAYFIKYCNLVEFDGRSDECLEETYPFPRYEVQ